VAPIGALDNTAANVTNAATDAVLNNPVTNAGKQAAVSAANAVYGVANAITQFAVGHPLTAGLPTTNPITLPSLPSLVKNVVIVDTPTATVVVVNNRTFVFVKPPPDDPSESSF
jgi:hypothetical protein